MSYLQELLEFNERVLRQNEELKAIMESLDGSCKEDSGDIKKKCMECDAFGGNDEEEIKNESQDEGESLVHVCEFTQNLNESVELNKCENDDCMQVVKEETQPGSMSTDMFSKDQQDEVSESGIVDDGVKGVGNMDKLVPDEKTIPESESKNLQEFFEESSTEEKEKSDDFVGVIPNNLNESLNRLRKIVDERMG